MTRESDCDPKATMSFSTLLPKTSESHMTGTASPTPLPALSPPTGDALEPCLKVGRIAEERDRKMPRGQLWPGLTDESSPLSVENSNPQETPPV